MPKYIPPGLRNKDQVYVPGKKKVILTDADFPALPVKINTASASASASTWITNKIDIEKLKDLKNKKIKNDNIQKVSSTLSLDATDPECDDTEDTEEYFSDEVNNNFDEDDEDFHKDVTNYIKTL